MIGPLATHVTLREAIELSVNEWREFFEGFFLTVAPRFKKLSKFVSSRLVHLGSGIYHIGRVLPQIFADKRGSYPKHG